MNAIDAESLRSLLGGGIEVEAAAAAARLADRAAREGDAEVAFAGFDSPVGSGFVAATERGIVSVALPNRERDEFLDDLAAGVSPRVLEVPARLDAPRRQLDEYFNGARRGFELELDWRLVHSDFYSRVLHETARLPYGATSSYGEIAAAAGNPRAHRAAGTALATNPLPIVVPCHRIVRAGGALGSYGGGPELKRWLLRHEGAID